MDDSKENKLIIDKIENDIEKELKNESTIINNDDIDFFDDCITLDDNFELYLDDNQEFINVNIEKQNDINNDINNDIIIDIDDNVYNRDNIIKELEYLLNTDIIPKYLYPSKIDEEYINLISNYLYKHYIYRKINGGMYTYRKSRNINFGMPSKLRICKNVKNIKDGKLFNNLQDNIFKIIDKENDIIYSLTV